MTFRRAINLQYWGFWDVFGIHKGEGNKKIAACEESSIHTTQDLVLWNGKFIPEDIPPLNIWFETTGCQFILDFLQKSFFFSKSYCKNKKLLLR